MIDIKINYNVKFSNSIKERNVINVIQQNITISEVIEMIKKLKLKTAPGEDRISMEAFKYAGQEVMAAITNLCQRMWSEGMISKDLQKSLIIPLYKKGDKTQTVNAIRSHVTCTD